MMLYMPHNIMDFTIFICQWLFQRYEHEWLWPGYDNMGSVNFAAYSQIARFMGPTWGPPGSCWPQVGPMLAPINLAIRDWLQAGERLLCFRTVFYSFLHLSNETSNITHYKKGTLEFLYKSVFSKMIIINIYPIYADTKETLNLCEFILIIGWSDMLKTHVNDHMFCVQYKHHVSVPLYLAGKSCTWNM